MTLSHPTAESFFTYVEQFQPPPVFRAQAKRCSPRWDASFDVVIVGSGAAGLSAALSAMRLGAADSHSWKKCLLRRRLQNLLRLLQRVGSAAQRAMHIEDSLELLKPQTH